MKIPVFLYTGPEFGKRNDAVDAAKKNFQKEFGQLDEHLFYLQETPFSEVMTILQSGTLFSNGVCVVCKGVELLKKKEDIQMLENWIKNPSQSAGLILVSDEISVDNKLEKIIPEANKKKFWEMFESERLSWVKSFFNQNQLNIETDAAELILDMVENNTLALKNECSRFVVLFPKNTTITADDVEKVLVHNREENPFTLFNAIADSDSPAEKRFESGVEILQKIRLSKDNSSVVIIAGLSSCFRRLVDWHNINKDYYGADETTLKQNGFASKPMRTQYRKAAKIWTTGQATAILAVLASTDMEIRSSGKTMEDVLLYKMLYEIVVKKGASISVAEY